jgi:hypothetical protein
MTPAKGATERRAVLIDVVSRRRKRDGFLLAEVVRQTWLDGGRTEVTSEETSPQFAEYAKKHSVLT